MFTYVFVCVCVFAIGAARVRCVNVFDAVRVLKLYYLTDGGGGDNASRA